MCIRDSYNTATQLESIARSVREPLSSAILKGDIPEAEAILASIKDVYKRQPVQPDGGFVANHHRDAENAKRSTDGNLAEYRWLYRCADGLPTFKNASPKITSPRHFMRLFSFGDL